MIQRSFNSFGCFVLSIAALIGSILIIGLFIRGGVWIADKVLPVLLLFSVGLFIFNVIVCIPMAFFRRSKEFAGKALFFSSYFYGLLLWLGCLVVTFKLWGWAGIILGLILVGVGLVPIAIIATIFAGLWIILLHIIVLILIIWLTRTFGANILRECYAGRNPDSFDTPEYSDAGSEVIDVDSVNIKDEKDI